MARIDDLVARYQNHISAPWQKHIAGAQRAIFVVYPPADERKLRARLDLFTMATHTAGHTWRSFDFTPVFARWMAGMDYREAYFEEPADLELKLQSDFCRFAAGELRNVLTSDGVDENSVVIVHGIGSLFGFTRVSLVLKDIENSIRGRLAVLFPGEYENNVYRMLDARDGWNYLAVPITLHGGMTEP